MRHWIVILSALLVPLTAYAQAAPKQVEVVNPVLAVEVVNPAPPAPPARFQLIGFTTTEFGNFNSIPGTPSLFDMIAACQAEVDPLSRMCRVDDIQLTTAIPSGLPTVDERTGDRLRAWLNPDPANAGVASGTFDCVGWSITSLTGMTVDATGQMARWGCDKNRPVACCALVP